MRWRRRWGWARRETLGAWILGTLWLVGASPAAGTPLLYGVSSVYDGLATVDPETGASTIVGSFGPDFPVPVSMDVHPETGTLYGWNNKSGINGLFTIDPITGEPTVVNPGGPSPERNFGNLAFSDDGSLYAISGGVWSIDLDTGVPTQLTGGVPDASGADFGPDGRLYGATSSGWLLSGISVLDGSWESDLYLTLDGERFYPDVIQLQAIVFDEDGNLLGSGFYFPTGSSVLFDIDPTSGAVTNLRTSLGHQGLAYAVPEAGAPLLLAMALAAAGSRRWRSDRFSS